MKTLLSVLAGAAGAALLLPVVAIALLWLGDDPHHDFHQAACLLRHADSDLLHADQLFDLARKTGCGIPGPLYYGLHHLTWIEEGKSIRHNGAIYTID